MSQDAPTLCELDKVMEVARRMSYDTHLVWFEAILGRDKILEQL